MKRFEDCENVDVEDELWYGFHGPKDYTFYKMMRGLIGYFVVCDGANVNVKFPPGYVHSHTLFLRLETMI